MPGLYDALKTRIREVAEAMELPLGWEGEPFAAPEPPYLRARIVLAASGASSLGRNGLTRDAGFAEITVAVPAGQDSLAVELARRFAGRFPRGMHLPFDGGSGTILTPGKRGPSSDGKRTSLVLNINFYAHYRA